MAAWIRHAYNWVSAPITSVFVNDTFTDAAGTPLQNHTGESGASWTLHPTTPGSLLITSAGRVRFNTSSAPPIYYASGIPATAEYDVEADVYNASDVDEYHGIMGRVSTSENTGYVAGYLLA